MPGKVVGKRTFSQKIKARKRLPLRRHQARLRTKKIKVIFVCRVGQGSSTDARAFKEYLRKKGLSARFEVQDAGYAQRHFDTIVRGADIVVSTFFNQPRGKYDLQVRAAVKQIAPRARLLRYAHSQPGHLDTQGTFRNILRTGLRQAQQGKKGKLAKSDKK